jgi:hypothetical protein
MNVRGRWKCDYTLASGCERRGGGKLEFAQIFTLRDREIVLVEIYLDRNQALEAAGLRE